MKKAIVERLREKHKVETLNETGPRSIIEGGPAQGQGDIDDRHDRPGVAQARLSRSGRPSAVKETLAATIVLVGYWRDGRPLHDPFCGSGTIPIEAAWIGRNMAPGLHREFDAQSGRVYRESIWPKARDEARDLGWGDSNSESTGPTSTAAT